MEKTRDEQDLEAYRLTMEHRGWSTWQCVDESWCYYWWWDEDPDGPPIPVHVLHSPTEDKFFASVGQHGWTRPQNVEDMGGWWMKITPPDITRHPQS